jgi:hypothetical protein
MSERSLIVLAGCWTMFAVLGLCVIVVIVAPWMLG